MPTIVHSTGGGGQKLVTFGARSNPTFLDYLCTPYYSRIKYNDSSLYTNFLNDKIRTFGVKNYFLTSIMKNVDFWLTHEYLVPQLPHLTLPPSSFKGFFQNLKFFEIF